MSVVLQETVKRQTQQIISSLQAPRRYKKYLLLNLLLTIGESSKPYPLPKVLNTSVSSLIYVPSGRTSKKNCLLLWEWSQKVKKNMWSDQLFFDNLSSSIY